MITVFLRASNLPALKFSPGGFIMARGNIARFITGALVFPKLLVSRLPDFEFPARGIILFRLGGLKTAALSLTAVLGINIPFKPLRWVILYEVLLGVLPGDVFGLGAGFLIKVLLVIRVAVLL